MNNYELMVIFTPVLSEEEFRAEQKKYAKFLADNGGTLVAQNAWGLKSLAYPIHKKTTGLYWVLEYAAEMKRRGIAIPFECITRADRLSGRVAGALAELGCFRVWIGSESGSQRVLDAMQRGVKTEQVREAVALCRAHGMQVGMFLMWGYEGEQPADIEATVDHVKACLPDVFLTTVSYPIKGTPYYAEVAQRLVGIGDWARSTDRDLKIAGRHSRRYYSFADQLLKSEVALARSGDAALRAQIQAARKGLAEAYQEVEA